MSPRAIRAVLRVGAVRAEVDLRLDAGRLTGRLKGKQTEVPVDARVERAADGTLTLTRDGRTVRARVVRTSDRSWVSIEGCSFEVEREEPGARPRAAAAKEAFAVSPMTGLVAKVGVAPGQKVSAGTALFVVEAMKMEYAVKAPRDVTVAEVRRKAGEKVSLGEVVVTFAEAP